MNSLTEFREWVINLNESTLDEIVSYYDEKVFFKDPFNEFNGREKLKKLFLHMFITFKNPHFVFIDTIENSEGIFFKRFEIHRKVNFSVRREDFIL